MKLYDDQLAGLGLGLQGVVNTRNVALPEFIRDYRQLLIFAHTGGELWRNIELEGEDPLDKTSIRLADDFMRRIGETDYEIAYPTDLFAIDLIAFGRQLGWHNDSKLSIGINAQFGTWFAYRFAIAANTNFFETAFVEAHPCETCVRKPCIDACPGAAVTEGVFDLSRCSIERLRPDSDCAENCAARLACPVGTEYRYEPEQVRYHYGRSLVFLRAYQEDS